MESCFCVPAPHRIIVTEWDVIGRLFLLVLNPLSCSRGYTEYLLAVWIVFQRRSTPSMMLESRQMKSSFVLIPTPLTECFFFEKTMKIKVWDFPLNLEQRWFKEGRSLNDQRSPLDQIKIELEPSQITGPQFRLGKPFSLPGGCPPVALKRIFHILGSRWRLPSVP